MFRLHIPLGHHSATRRSRRVVWILALPPLCAWLIASWYLGRPDIGRIAPEGTTVIVRLRPGNHWAEVLDQIGGWPAVSSRGLTVRDLAGYAQGEIALFIKEDGSWDAGMRHASGALPQTMLDAQSIALQPEGRGLFLLSARTESVIPAKLHAPAPWKRSLFGKTIGELYLKTNNAWEAGSIEVSKTGWRIRLPATSHTDPVWKHLPEGTIASLTTPVWTDADNARGVTGRMDAVLKTFDVISLQQLAKQWLTGPGFLTLTSDQEGLGMLISGPAESLSLEDGKRLLTTASALQTPSTTKWVLADQTTTQEIHVDPSAVSIEERTLYGIPVMEARTREGATFLFARTARGYILTNRERLMVYWLDAKGPQTKETTACQGEKTAFLDLRTFFEVSAPTLASQEPNALRLIAEHFEHMSVQNTWFSTEIQLCY